MKTVSGRADNYQGFRREIFNPGIAKMWSSRYCWTLTGISPRQHGMMGFVVQQHQEDQNLASRSLAFFSAAAVLSPLKLLFSVRGNPPLVPMRNFLPTRTAALDIFVRTTAKDGRVKLSLSTCYNSDNSPRQITDPYTF